MGPISPPPVLWIPKSIHSEISCLSPPPTHTHTRPYSILPTSETGCFFQLPAPFLINPSAISASPLLPPSLELARLDGKRARPILPSSSSVILEGCCWIFIFFWGGGRGFAKACKIFFFPLCRSALDILFWGGGQA